jgi:tetratricopeptide (TPR) repeat protein
MKLINILFLTIIFAGWSSIYGQVKPTPTPSVSPPPTGEIRESIFKTRTTSIEGIPAKTQKDAENAIKLMQEDSHEQAIAAWTNIIKTNPRLMIAFNNRGYSYMQSGKLDLAIEDFNTALKLSPVAMTYINRGMAFSKKRDFTSALADYSKAIQLDPKDSLIYNNRADVYLQMGNFELGLADQNKAISIMPKEALYLSNRCFTYVKMKSSELAIKDCSEAIQLNPKMALAYSNRGLAYFQISKLESALDDYNTALKLNDTLYQLYVDRGYILLKLGRFEDAVESLSKALSMESVAVTHLLRASAYSKLNKPDLEFADYNKAIEIDPNNAIAYNNRGIYLLKNGDKTGALNNFNKAIELNPKLGSAYQNRAFLYNQIGEKEKAQADEKMAQTLENNKPPN